VPVLYNAETGLAENLSPEQSQAAISSGTHEVPLVDDSGEFFSAPHADAQTMLSQGYKQPSTEQLQKMLDKSANEAPEEKAKAFVEGAAEMASLGTSPAIEQGLGISTEENIKRRRESGYHTAGQFVGALNPLGPEEAIATGVGKMVASKIAAPVASKIGSTAAKFAVDNAIFQSKDEVAKLMVHDPEQSTETALTNIGMAGLLGGALGAGGAGAAELWKLGPGAKLGQLMDGLKNKSSGLPDNLKSTAGIDLAPELAASLGDNPKAREAAQILMESNSKSGAELQKAMADFKVKASEAVGETLGHTPESLDALADLSKADVGRNLQEQLARSIEEKVQPLAEKYEAVNEKFSSHALDESTKADIADKVAAHIQESGLAKGPNEKALNLAQKVLEQLPKQETVQDLRKYAQGLYQTAPFGSEQYATGKALRAIFNDAQDKIVGDVAGGEFKALQAEYGRFKGLMEDLNDRLHAGREAKAGAKSFAKAVREMSPEDVVRRLNLKGDVNLQALLAEHFSEVSAASTKYELDALIKASLNKEGGIDINKFSKKIAALEPEHRGHLMSPEMLKRVEAIKELVDRVPGKMNTGGNAKTLDKLWEKLPAGVGALISMLTGHNPVIGAVLGQMSHYIGREVPDNVRLAMLKFIGSDAHTSATGFAAAAKMAGNIAKGEKALDEAVKTIFRGGTFAVTANLADSREKLKKHIAEALADPEKLMEIAGETGHYMPDHAALLTASASKAVQYLSTLKPNDQPQAPLDAKVKVSKAAEAKYNRALDIANQPLLVLKGLKDGTATAQDVGHLRALYPALANRIQAKLGQEIIDHKAADESIPYRTQMALSMFLGQPLTSSLNQPNIMAAQPIPAMQPTAAKVPKVTGAKMDKLGKLPGIYETPQQHRTAYRTSKH